MSELLVKAVDASHSEPLINLSGCYKRGDVVVVMPDGHQWGSKELDITIFNIIKMPGVSVAAMKYLLNSHNEPIPNTAALKVPALHKSVSRKSRKILNRKRYSIDLTSHQITDKARA